ncbi:unnamed protein product [Soboliphyme baturini]|uniref:Antistasin-like domain-containing protein n=1 Tax=Soboliphyme baturini TaxID=241478 RepID=A0A183IJI3_9BILA|nr:unnamed protein product [Soboliphyme baturini]
MSDCNHLQQAAQVLPGTLALQRSPQIFDLCLSTNYRTEWVFFRLYSVLRNVTRFWLSASFTVKLTGMWQVEQAGNKTGPRARTKTFYPEARRIRSDRDHATTTRTTVVYTIAVCRSVLCDVGRTTRTDDVHPFAVDQNLFVRLGSFTRPAPWQPPSSSSALNGTQQLVMMARVAATFCVVGLMFHSKPFVAGRKPNYDKDIALSLIKECPMTNCYGVNCSMVKEFNDCDTCACPIG